MDDSAVAIAVCTSSSRYIYGLLRMNTSMKMLRECFYEFLSFRQEIVY